ncbi:hypothetical protein AGMMS49949_09660 [Alphaproteobacteria bacterium]|nr:hypothetical protein AGMMS49949_09660 [Alphaproteobacteria bacterium]GHT00182.1 hypothetical protein AGMMS50296_8460 [Alphaproteobacteria bacterium]
MGRKAVFVLDETRTPVIALLIHKALKQPTEPNREVLTEEKKIKGRKRPIVTDLQGHLLYVTVHAANIHDTVAGGPVFEQALKRYSKAY